MMSCPTLERNLSSNFFLDCEVNGVMLVFNLIFGVELATDFALKAHALLPGVQNVL